ncbi:MAG: GtrA family protein [Patescibacteria group bacterium]
MTNKIILLLWNSRKEFVKYFTIGISAFIADVGCLFVLKEFFGLPATLAVIIYQPFIVYGVFYLNKHWSFQAGGITHRQIIRFIILTAANYGISIVWMYFAHDRMGIQYLIARTLNIALSVAWNFLLYKYWVYQENLENAEKTPVQAK